MPTTKARGRKSARIVLLAGTAVYTDFKNIKNNADGRGERRGEEEVIWKTVLDDSFQG